MRPIKYQTKLKDGYGKNQLFTKLKRWKLTPDSEAKMLWAAKFYLAIASMRLSIASLDSWVLRSYQKFVGIRARHWVKRTSRASSFAWPLDQPLQHGIEIGLFLGADTVAANFAVGYCLKVECLDQFVNRELFRQVRLIAENKQRNSIKNRFFEQGVELFASYWKSLLVCGINNVAWDLLASYG